MIRVGQAIVFYDFSVTHGDIGEDMVYERSLSVNFDGWNKALSEFLKLAQVKGRLKQANINDAIREIAHDCAMGLLIHYSV